MIPTETVAVSETRIDILHYRYIGTGDSARIHRDFLKIIRTETIILLACYDNLADVQLR
jgi:hypothetical protein